MKWRWPTLQSPSRNPYVDWLRGFSILVVVFAHFSAICGPFTQPWVVPFDFVRAFGRNSCFGVSIFFVVSGFLITTSSIQRFGSLGTTRLRDFYVYRASRILPLLVLLTVINLTCLYAGAPDFALNSDVSVGRLLGYLFTFRFNQLYLTGGAVLAPWAVLWSLAVEEVFYLGYPLLCRILRRDALIIVALLGFIILGPIVRHREGWSGMYAYTGCFDQLAFGCLAGLAAQRFAAAPWLRRSAVAMTAVGGVATLTLYFWKDAHLDGYWVPAPTGIGISAAVFILGSSALKTRFERIPTWLQGWTMRLLGVLSYELYLFHMPLFLALKPVSAWIRGHTHEVLPRDAAFVVVVPLLIVAGSIVAVHFGQPAQRIVRGLFVRRAPAPVEVAQAGT